MHFARFSVFFRLNWLAMKRTLSACIVWGAALAVAVSTISAVAQRDDSAVSHPGESLILKHESAGTVTSHRLILKDGSYQIVRRYVISGDRLRYISAERSGVWEEMPFDLVDWEATRKWERDHATQLSLAMKEATEIDKEEAAEREGQKTRRPEVAPGLELPDRDSVFALDTRQGTPELVELRSSELSVNNRARRGLVTLNPLNETRATLELEGSTACVHLHGSNPSIYISLESRENADQVISHAQTVNTRGAKDTASRKHGARSEKSGFAVVRADSRRAVRIVGAVHVSVKGGISQSERVVPARFEAFENGHWLKITPTAPLTTGEYALVEILSTGDMSQTVWDFRVDSSMGENPGAMTPTQKRER